MSLAADPLKLNMAYVEAEIRDLKDILVHYAGIDLTPDVVEQLLEDLSNSMKARKDIIRRSLSDIFHRRIENHSALAARLAMSGHRIREGIPWCSWGAVYSQPEWMYLQPVHILEKEDPYEDGKLIYQVMAQVIAGSAGPGRLKFHWTWAQIKYCSKAIGFTTIRKMETMFQHPYDIYGLQFLAKVAPPKETDRPCRILEVAKSTKLMTRNRLIIDARARLNFECPFKFEHTCNHCVKGLDECDVATHRHTYVTGLCSRCSRESHMDPDPRYGSTTVCIRCRRKDRDSHQPFRQRKK